jgi:thymidylate synthase (FAD)
MTNAIAKLNRKTVDAGFTFAYPSFSVLAMPTLKNINQFEIAARTCYQSEDKMTSDGSSGAALMNKIFKLNHTAMIEFFPDLVVKFRVNRGVTHELVRMRLCSFAQESTRYVRYKNVNFILPAWANALSLGENILTDRYRLFLKSCSECAETYSERLNIGCSPQEARGSLNNDVAAYINMKANLREWLHIFGLRCASAAHPDMRMIMCGFVMWLKNSNPLFHNILEQHYPTVMSDLVWFNKNYLVNHVGEENFVIPYVDMDQGRDEGDPWADK